ncbi:glutaminase [uncultured Dokdonia sp.]|uniref:glutaminase n=1 Tax=uncultured Dokdonia sp. TaxID=575653 RepID=UPI002602FF22|nr:glutaminase [uncultured Dokdonia sp.]
MDCHKIIEDTYAHILSKENKGAVATYIPELGKVDPAHFGVCLTTNDGTQYTAGDAYSPFSIQSIAKVLSLSLALSLEDTMIWQRLDVEPSGSAFNSLVQLESENGIPRNPLINAGAIVVCDILCSHLKDPKKELIGYIRDVANNDTIQYSETIAQSEKSNGYLNVALVNFMKSFGNIKNDVEQVIDLYFYLSSIEMTCCQLSKTFGFLANGGKQLITNKQILTRSQSQRVNAIMQTCGFYDEAGEFAYKVGLPGKSGVGGGIVAVLPNSYSISVWSPKLNEKGNSYRGMKFLQLFTDTTRETIF